MSWKLSRFRAGDWVEVRSREEILAGLDANGRLDGMPFMPEMLEMCGKRFRVRAVAHKTCDTAKQTWSGRRIDAAVHLDGAFCDGSAHGGCEAACALFWKDAWLRPAGELPNTRPGPSPSSRTGCTDSDLHAHTRRAGEHGSDVRYVCQATELYDYTGPLATWDVRQYLYDVWTRNYSVFRVARVLFLASLRWIQGRLPFGYRIFKAFNDFAHRSLTGRPVPMLTTHIEDGARTPIGRLDLKAGEYVRIKSQPEIEPTLDKTGRNRGLTFYPEEMAQFCNRVVKVRRSVHKIIDEPTGKMIEMKQPCIMLEGVTCTSEFAPRRLNCPREIVSYWRELWLERVDPPAVAGTGESSDR